MKNIVLLTTRKDSCGSGGASNYPNVNKQEILNYLNNNSHNQLHVKWELAQPSVNYIDTLDISSDYILNPNGLTFTKSTNILNYLKNKYIAKYQINVESNPENQYFFVTNLTNVMSQSGGISGGINGTGGNSGAFFVSILNKFYVYSHELGHGLGLNHTFENNGSKNIPQGKTSNFMDYNSSYDTWFRYQYLRILNNIK